MNIFSNHPLMDAIQDQYRLDYRSGIHGLKHWEKVRENGLRLAAATGARTDVIELFAVLHDACRHSDGRDLEHGPRAAAFAASLRSKVFRIDEAGFQLLIEAIRDHTKGLCDADITVQTCWDADRLDLGRVGITPIAERMCTAQGKKEAGGS